MDGTRTFSISSNGCDSTKAIDFNTNIRENLINGATLSSEKILQLCSARSSALSRLNETFIVSTGNAEAQSLLINTNGHGLQSPTISLPPTQTVTSFSNFPRFPHPTAMEESSTSNRFNSTSFTNTQVVSESFIIFLEILYQYINLFDSYCLLFVHLGFILFVKQVKF